MYFVYFLKSQRNNKIYVGFTTKVPSDRTQDHNYGSNQWTKQNGPFDLIYFESFFCEKDARAREKFYKSGFGKKIKYAIVSTLDSKNSVSSKGRPTSGRG